MIAIPSCHPKRFYIENAVCFITTKTHNGFPYFKKEELCKLFIEELRVCKRIKIFELYDFYLLLDHFHLLLKPNGIYNISKIIQSLKKEFTRDANSLIVGEITESRQHEEGGGDNIEVAPPRLQGNKLIIKCNKTHPRFYWQKSFYDHIIRDEEDLLNHMKYTKYNYQKHNLPNNWQYTSLNYPELLDDINT
ncbi:transposase [Patescibacteria group bacterium]|nr:transposase [Patescibacteria group bacterium]MBU1890395.1 transposase [Patescibacteria group bacterium]